MKCETVKNPKRKKKNMKCSYVPKSSSSVEKVSTIPTTLAVQESKDSSSLILPKEQTTLRSKFAEKKGQDETKKNVGASTDVLVSGISSLDDSTLSVGTCLPVGEQIYHICTKDVGVSLANHLFVGYSNSATFKLDTFYVLKLITLITYVYEKLGQIVIGLEHVEVDLTRIPEGMKLVDASNLTVTIHEQPQIALEVSYVVQSKDFLVRLYNKPVVSYLTGYISDGFNKKPVQRMIERDQLLLDYIQT